MSVCLCACVSVCVCKCVFLCVRACACVCVCVSFVLNVLSYVGSLARLRNKQTLSMEPFSSKSDLKNLAVSMFT